MPLGVVGLTGILIGFSAVLAVGSRDRNGLARLSVVLLIAAVQISVSIYFWYWAQTNTTDASMYYHDPYGFYARGFGISTQFVIWLVHSIKAWFGGTYLDFFLLFQAAGTWGAVFLLKTFEEIYRSADLALPTKFLLLLFLPGLHFWTAFIGKDGFLFLGAAMAGWAAVNIKTRWLAFGIGTGLMVLFRPHIALVAVASAAAALFFDKRLVGLSKFALGFLAVVGLLVGALTIQSTFKLDVSNADAVADFLTRQGQLHERVEGTTNLAEAPFLVKLLSLLFRPLFFDASGLPGLIASFENLLLLIVLGYLMANGRLLVVLARRVYLVRFSLLFATALILLLSLVNYNVGLGLRQKTMAMPGILTLFVAVAMSRRLWLGAGRAPRVPLK